MSEFNNDGIIIDRYPTIRENLSDDFKTAFGEDTLSNSAESIIGNITSIISSTVDGQNEMVQGVTDAFNPNAATGYQLSTLVLFNGIKRKEAVYSTCSVEVTAGTAPTVIPKGRRVSNPDETQIWTIDDDVSLAPLETKDVSVTCIVDGPIFAQVNTITKILDPVYSWESVDNSVSSTIGRTEESDAELRTRRAIVAAGISSSSEPAIFRQLTGIEAVESVYLYFNKTDAPDIYGNPPQSIWAIVKGGSNADIAEVLAEYPSGGLVYIGDIDEIYTDPENGKEYPIKFDRPTEILNYIKVVISTNQLFPADGVEQIKQQIADYYDGDFTIDGRQVPGFGVGQNIVYSRLYSPINSVPGHEILELYLDTVSPPTGTSTLVMDIYQQGVVDKDTTIEVEVI